MYLDESQTVDRLLARDPYDIGRIQLIDERQQELTRRYIVPILPQLEAEFLAAVQVLVYPAVDLTRDPEPIADPDGVAFPRAMAQTRERYVGAADPDDPDISPLRASDLADLPPAVVCVAEYDSLRPQGLAYAERLRDAGVPVEVVDAHGLDHAFLAWGTFARRPAEGSLYGTTWLRIRPEVDLDAEIASPQRKDRMPTAVHACGRERLR